MTDLLRIIGGLHAFVPVAAQARAHPGLPDYLDALDRAYDAGDWTLQCNSTRLCQIIGAARPSSKPDDVRAVVLINRGIRKGASPSVRIGFIDGQGDIVPLTPGEDWRLLASGLPKRPPPLKPGFAAQAPDGAFRIGADRADKVVRALRNWPATSIRNRAGLIARMPRGNLSRLQAKMERLQHPGSPRMTPAEDSAWLKEYHYVVERPSPADHPAPSGVVRSCPGGAAADGAEGLRFSGGAHLWLARCGALSVIHAETAQGSLRRIDPRDTAGQVYSEFRARLVEGAKLQIDLPRAQGHMCGQQMTFGHAGGQFFMLDHRRYNRCRKVPPQFWPRLWYPTSWKFSNTSPSNGGNAPPSIEGVRKP